MYVVCFIICVRVVNGCAMNIYAAFRNDHLKKMHLVTQCFKERM